MANCSGTPETLPNGIKDCTNCTLPHTNYEAVIDKLKKECQIMKTVRVVQCKECKHFEKNSWCKLNGVPIIIAHDICNFWGEGCKTDPNGYCFAGESVVETKEAQS